MDIICNKKLHELLHYDLVLTHSFNIETSFTNAFFMVIPNHPFLNIVLNT